MARRIDIDALDRSHSICPDRRSIQCQPNPRGSRSSAPRLIRAAVPTFDTFFSLPRLRCSLDFCRYLFMPRDRLCEVLIQPRCRRFRQKPSGSCRLRTIIIRGSPFQSPYSDCIPRHQQQLTSRLRSLSHPDGPPSGLRDARCSPALTLGAVNHLD